MVDELGADPRILRVLLDLRGVLLILLLLRRLCARLRGGPHARRGDEQQQNDEREADNRASQGRGTHRSSSKTCRNLAL